MISRVGIDVFRRHVRSRHRPIVACWTSWFAFLLSGSMGVAVIIATPAVAAPLPDTRNNFHLTVIDDSVTEALKQFGIDTGLRVNVSDEVDGHVASKITATSVRDFLNRISQDYGLDWYYDGFAVYVTTDSEAVSRTIPISYSQFTTLQSVLGRGEISDARYPLRLAADNASARVSGPPRFIELVEKTVQALKTPERNSLATPASTIIFRGSGRQQITFDDNGNP